MKRRSFLKGAAASPTLTIPKLVKGKEPEATDILLYFYVKRNDKFLLKTNEKELYDLFWPAQVVDIGDSFEHGKMLAAHDADGNVVRKAAPTWKGIIRS